jgi:hypothetical protein
MQIQGFPTSLAGTTSTGETIVAGTQQQQPQPGQMLFGPQTVLRIANALRLSQLRLPSNNATMPGNVRAPAQHRILLTRGAVPGQPVCKTKYVLFDSITIIIVYYSNREFFLDIHQLVKLLFYPQLEETASQHYQLRPQVNCHLHHSYNYNNNYNCKNNKTLEQ